jgi:hypothetical protein
MLVGRPVRLGVCALLVRRPVKHALSVWQVQFLFHVRSACVYVVQLS